MTTVARRWRRCRRCALVLLAAGWPGTGAEAPGGAATPPALVRLAFTSGITGGINSNDAKASIIAWGRAVLQQQRIARREIEPSIFDSPAELFRALQAGRVDGAAVMTDEFLARPAGLEAEEVYLSMRNGAFTERYVLVVHQAGGIGDIGGLKGRSLELHHAFATSLARPWLDLTLAGAGLGRAEAVLKKIGLTEKASRAVMRVFFRQLDAAIVTQSAFATMGELNPQLSRDLRVLATSPEVVPSLFFLRPNLSGQFRQELETTILTAHETAGGRQALTVFQGERMVKRPISALDGARELLAAAARLPSPDPGSAPAGAPTAPSPSR